MADDGAGIDPALLPHIFKPFFSGNRSTGHGLGLAFCQQLEPAGNLSELAEIALSQGWDAGAVQDIRNGSRLVDLEMQQALGAGRQPGPCEAFVVTGEAGRLHAAVFAIGEPFSPGLNTSYARLLANHGERRLPED